MESVNKHPTVYNELRSGIFQLSKTVDGSENATTTLVMEFYRPSAVVTLVGMLDGTASIYFSSGGGVLGAGNHENVQQLAQEFVEAGNTLLSSESHANSYPAPAREHVRFYLVTASGVRTLEAIENELGNNLHICSGLFHKGHELIGAIRRTESTNA